MGKKFAVRNLCLKMTCSVTHVIFQKIQKMFKHSCLYSVPSIKFYIPQPSLHPEGLRHISTTSVNHGTQGTKSQMSNGLGLGGSDPTSKILCCKQEKMSSFIPKKKTSCCFTSFIWFLRRKTFTFFCASSKLDQETHWEMNQKITDCIWIGETRSCIRSLVRCSGDPARISTAPAWWNSKRLSRNNRVNRFQECWYNEMLASCARALRGYRS